MANAGSGFAQMVSTAKYTDLDSAIPYSQPELQSSLGQQIPPTGHTPTSWQVSYERPGIQDEPSQQTYSTGYSAWPGSGSSSSVYPTGYPSYSQQPDSSTHEQPAYALGFGQQIQVSGYGQDVQSSGYPQDFTQNTSSQGNLQYSYSHVPQNLFNVPHTATMIATPQWSVSGAGRSVNPYGAQFVYWTKERLDAVRNEHRTKSKNWTRLSIVKYDGKEAILNQASKIFDDGNIPDLSPQRFEIRTMEAEKAPRETEIDYEFAKEYMKVITKRTKKTLASMLAEIVPRSASINEVLAFNIDRCSSIESRAVYYTLFKNILQALDQIYRHIEVKAAYQTNSQVLLDKDGTTVSKMTADGERLHGFPHRKNLPIVRSYTVTKYRDPEGFESVHGGTLVFMPHQNGPNLEILGDCLKMKSPEDWPAGIICRPFDKDKYGEMLPGEPDAPKPSRNMMDIVNHEVNGQKAYTCLPWIEDVCKRRDGRTSKYVIGPLFIYMKRVI
jgi:hypothetical protein